jgi:class 3 adenylate cyclase
MATTKRCPGCQADIPDESRFCPQCGAPQSLACAACGHVNAAGSRFCAQCGAKLGAAAAPAPSAPSPQPAPVRPVAAAERRQLTVMFCDLVGSTALSTKLDPEDLRHVISAYHKCVAAAAERFHGFVAKYMGDGVLVYFGYPEAREADAANAVRAALATIEDVGKLDVSAARQQVRVGIATGLVVVGELVGEGAAQERNVVGETPNLAARLQSAAAPNTVLIAASTRRLTGDLFHYEAAETGALKGFDGPIAAWRVLREQSMQSRFDALRAANQLPLIGREEELDLLTRRWQQAKQGEGRVVLLSGEPGIGKSRLIGALIDRAEADGGVCPRYFCLPHQQGSALQPIIAQLSHAAGFDRDDGVAVKRAKLERLFAQTSDDAAAAADAFSGLLDLDAVAASTIDAQRKRIKVLAALLDQLVGVARRKPVLMVFEDAHWSDPTSIELLSLTVERVPTLPVLLIVTHRPDFQAPWAGQPHVTTMALNRLGRRERAAMVERLTGGKALPAALLEQIIERTDGVPLFVEELTKAVLESEEIDQPAQQLAIPTTLQGSLMARVDRLGSAREVLQIGAAIGREFSYELLAAVAGLADAVLQDALARLAEGELIFPRGTPPNATYSFKHALVQDAAYSTMLRVRRQQLHGAIAAVLEKRFPDTPPELLAQQFEGAGRADEAIRYWRKAGDRDLRRFALKEAVAHYASALRLVMAMPQTPQRDALELAVRLELGQAQQVLLGPTSKEWFGHFERALELSEARPQKSRELFLSTWGVWFGHTMMGHSRESFSYCDKLLAIAGELNDPDLRLEAYHAHVPGLMRRGEFQEMKKAALEVMQLYDRERHRDHAFFFGGHDAHVCAHCFHAMSLWALGFPEQAQTEAARAYDFAQTLDHAFSVAHSLNVGSLTHILLNDVEAIRAVADELYPLSERHKFAWPLAYARFQRGWLIAKDGNPREGAARMTEAITNAPLAAFHPIVWGSIAEQHLLVGSLDAARDALTQGASKGVLFFESEILRLRSAILLAESAQNAAEAEQLLRQALAITAAQSCRPLELRVATSLAQLLADNGRRDEARELLAPLYARFSEGFAHADWKAAKAVLDAL